MRARVAFDCEADVNPRHFRRLDVLLPEEGEQLAKVVRLLEGYLHRRVAEGMRTRGLPRGYRATRVGRKKWEIYVRKKGSEKRVSVYEARSAEAFTITGSEG